jgi:hypothetical protein
LKLMIAAVPATILFVVLVAIVSAFLGGLGVGLFGGAR